MDLTLNTKSTSDNKLDLFKDPFKRESVERVTFWLTDYEHSSKVYFSNGNTKGEQEIYADDFNTLVLKTQDFINSL